MTDISYTPTSWVDEVPASTPVLYNILDSGGSPIEESVQIELETATTPGTAVNAAHLNNMETAIAALVAKSNARLNYVLLNAASQAVASGDIHYFSFSTETFDPWGFANIATYPDRLTIPAGYSGLYLVGMNVVIGANATGTRYSNISKVGSPNVSYRGTELASPGARALYQTNFRFIYLAAGDYLKFGLYQDSGSSINCSTDAWAIKIG